MEQLRLYLKESYYELMHKGDMAFVDFVAAHHTYGYYRLYHLVSYHLFNGLCFKANSQLGLSLIILRLFHN